MLKFGSYVTSGVTNLVTIKNDDPNKKNTNLLSLGFGKLSNGIMSIGSKTKSLATNTGKFIKRKSNAMFVGESKEK